VLLKITAIKSWPDRAQTAQTVEILDEVLDPKNRGTFTSLKHSEISTMPTDADSFTTLPGQSWDGDAESKVGLQRPRTMPSALGKLCKISLLLEGVKDHKDEDLAQGFWHSQVAGHKRQGRLTFCVELERLPEHSAVMYCKTFGETI